MAPLAARRAAQEMFIGPRPGTDDMGETVPGMLVVTPLRLEERESANRVFFVFLSCMCVCVCACVCCLFGHVCVCVSVLFCMSVCVFFEGGGKI